MIRKNQICELAGLVDKRSKTDNERNLVECFPNLPSSGRGKHRISVVEQQDLCAIKLSSEQRAGKIAFWSHASRVFHRRSQREEHPSWRAHTFKQGVEGVDR